jgi:MYXO-CTERM domain-containing protein
MRNPLSTLAFTCLLAVSPAALYAQDNGGSAGTGASNDTASTATMDEDQGMRSDARDHDDDTGRSGWIGLLGLAGLLGLKRRERDRDSDPTLTRNAPAR